MSQMVDRVTAAIDLAEAGLLAGEGRESVARAAIAAMREPTKAMERAGRIELGKDDDGEIVYLQVGEVVEVWQSVIDEALSDRTRDGE
jgi:fructose-1,6-bisphosphatase/sedoheptulose 1,7-bisphosphatase-like protein